MTLILTYSVVLSFVYNVCNHAAPRHCQNRFRHCSRLWLDNLLSDSCSLFGEISVPCGTCSCPKPLLLQTGLRRTCLLQLALSFHISPNRMALPLLSACCLVLTFLKWFPHFLFYGWPETRHNCRNCSLLPRKLWELP